ncbi:hypothetical protein [Flexivirga caeni]|uniref:DUF3558 domain-containing protein n=1 Tax=Flexivirga caeni TaxID=2294115 RepID=A0A3M9MCG1_9MICO|nr:hypothetical protein [Flexivirga caeni]RNI23214.1 hypothetical protein EFY87_07200 [Flexivirga caeni]
MPETSRRRRVAMLCAGAAAAVAVAVPAVTAYAAGGAAPAKPGASISTHPAKGSKPATPQVSVTPYTPPNVPNGVTPTAATTITPSAHFSVQVDRTGKKPMDATWPSASEVFTLAELRQVLPELTAVKATQCRQGTLPGGGSTKKSTECTLALTITGEPDDDRSQLMINIRGFGLPQQIGKQWSADLVAAQRRSSIRPGLYTFFANNSLGVAAAYTDGTTTKVLLQHGDVAGEIWFSGIGFTTLSSDYLESRKLYRTAIVPALVQLLGAKFTDTEKAAA